MSCRCSHPKRAAQSCRYGSIPGEESAMHVQEDAEVREQARGVCSVAVGAGGQAIHKKMPRAGPFVFRSGVFAGSRCAKPKALHLAHSAGRGTGHVAARAINASLGRPESTPTQRIPGFPGGASMGHPFYTCISASNIGMAA